MGAEAFIGQLVNLGTGGAVIIALVYFWRMKEVSEKFLLDRIDKIVDRHLESEKASRDQIRELATQNRDLFDRVIAICNDLSLAVKDLRDATRSNDATTKALMAVSQANEQAIQELRADIKLIRGLAKDASP